MAWFKKKKAKAALEIPPPPTPEEAFPEKKAVAEKLEIPDKFHEIKFPKEEVPEIEEFELEEEHEVIKQPEEVAETEELFKPVLEVAKPEIPEMPELPEIPEIIEGKAEPVRMAAAEGPVFVKSRDYQEVLGKITKIKENVQQTENTFNRMNEIKNEKDKVLNQWKESLEDIQRKLIYVEKVLYEV